MSDTIITSSSDPVVKRESRSVTGLFVGRQGQKLRETLLAYALLLPAFLIIFTFGIFPLAFSAYESTLRGLNRIVGRYDGMGNYVRAIDNLAYVLGFWLAILCIVLAFRSLAGLRNAPGADPERSWLLVVPAVVLGTGFAFFTRFFFTFLPELLGVAELMRDAQRAGEGPPAALFRRFLGEIWLLPQIRQSFQLALAILVVGIALLWLLYRFIPRVRHQGHYFSAFLQATLLTIAAVALGWFTWSQVQAAYAAALEDGQTLDIWSQVVTISAGFVLLGLSWLVWRSASERDSTLSTFMRLAAGSILIIGGWVLIGELPQVIANGDQKWWTGLLNTIYYSIGAIPFQFAISLMLANFLFQNIKGKSLFRMIYFLPYITPAVGAAAVFRILFSGRESSPINQVLQAFGLSSLGWLNEPTGVFQLLLGNSLALPAWATGPSLSMVVIIIFGIWTFVGFNTVIFLAGLGAIPSALYEAASIDGAGRWAQFRHVTLPLLSPTIYFLTLYAVIGTFKAFNHIYVLRTPAALGTADTASIVIFDAMKRDTRYGYAAALAVLLLLIIIGLTAVNNRIASKRVFYG